MNKLVYMFELDSVKNSNEEVEFGQQALFEEIIVNGNQVALTYNQLVDSLVFLKALEKDETSILKLFDLHALQISQYKNYVSAKNYIINAIQDCIKASKTGSSDGFIFSGLPIKKDDIEALTVLRSTLYDSNPSILEEFIFKKEEMYIKAEEEGSNDKESLRIALKNLRSVQNYIQFFSKIDNSSSKKTIKPSHVTTTDLISYLNLILNQYLIEKQQPKIRLNKETKDSFVKALTLINEVEKNEFSEPEKKNKRSIWHKKLKFPNREKNTIEMAIIIVDLCYNYTVEESVAYISRRFDENDCEEFFVDFEKQLVKSWNVYLSSQNKIKRKCKHEDGNELKLPNWSVAVRLLEENKYYQSNNHETSEVILYSLDHFKWLKCIIRHQLKRLGSCIIHIIGWVFWVIVSCFIDKWANFDFLEGLGIYVFYILFTGIMGLITSLVIEKKLKIDLSKSLKELGMWFTDNFHYTKSFFSFLKKQK